MADSEGLQSELTLDIAAALRQVDALEEALARVTTDIPITADAGSVADSITAAVAAADSTVEATADASAVTGDIDAAVGAADGTVPVDESGADQITTAIDDAVKAADSQVEVTADTSQADSALGDLGQTADSTAGSMSNVSQSTADTSHNLDLLGAAALGAEGNARGLTATLGEMGASGKSAGLILGTLTAVTAGLFGEAVKAQGAEDRLSSAFGVLAGSIETVNVGNLNEDLVKLAASLGTTESDIKNSAATLQQFGINAGFSGEQAAHTTEEFIALAARAVALNPALGSVSDVADTMATRLARGGRFAQALGISLTAAEINAAALAATGKEVATDLTVYEKAAAAADLATQKYGDTLRQVIEEGTANPILRLRALRAEFTNAIETIGQPLVAPIFNLLETSLPLATSLATGFAGAIEALLPIINALVSTIALIPTPALAAGVAFATLFTALRAIVGLEVLQNFFAGLIAILQASTIAEEEEVASTLALASAQAEGAAATAAFAAAQLAAGEASQLAAEAEAEAAVATSLVNPIVAALTLAYIVYTAAVNDNKDARNRASKDTKDATTALTDYTRSVKDSIVEVNKSSDATKKLATGLADSGQTIDGFAAAQLRGSAATEQFIALTLAGAKASGESAKELLILQTFLEEQVAANQAGAKAALDNAVAQQFLTKAQRDGAIKTNTAKDGTVDYIAALNDLNPKLRAASSAEDDKAAADKAAADAQVKLSTDTAAFASTLVDLAGKHNDVAFALAGVEAATHPTAGAIEALALTTDKAKLSNEQYAAIAAKLGTDAGTLTATLQAVAAETNAFADAVISKLPSVDDAISGLGKNATPTELIKTLKEQEDNVNGFVFRIQALIDEGNVALAQKLAAAGPEIGGGLAKAFLDGEPGLRTAANAQVITTQGALDNAKAAADRWAPTFETTLGTAAADASKAWDDNLELTNSVDSAVALATDAALRGGASVGDALDAGLAAGIDRKAELVRAAAARLAFFAVSELQKRTGISSPSKVTAAIGDEFSRGLALGISRSTDEPVAAAGAQADATVAALTAAVDAAVGAGVSAVALGGSPATTGGPSLTIGTLNMDLSNTGTVDEARAKGEAAFAGFTDAAARLGLHVAVRAI